jgi:hypothetical protein
MRVAALEVMVGTASMSPPESSSGFKISPTAAIRPDSSLQERLQAIRKAANDQKRPVDPLRLELIACCKRFRPAQDAHRMRS